METDKSIYVGMMVTSKDEKIKESLITLGLQPYGRVLRILPDVNRTAVVLYLSNRVNSTNYFIKEHYNDELEYYNGDIL